MFSLKYVYKIDRNTAYSHPVYVHSHATSLLEANAKEGTLLRQDMERIKKKLEEIYKVSLDNAEKNLNFLTEETRKFQDKTGIKIENGELDNIFGKAKKIFDKHIEPFRKSLKTSGGTQVAKVGLDQKIVESIIESINRESNTTTIGSVINDLFRDTGAELVETIFSKNLERAYKKKTNTNKSLDVSALTVGQVKEIFSGKAKNSMSQSKKLIKDLSRKTVLSEDKDLKTYFKDFIKKFEEMIDYSKRLNSESIKTIGDRIQEIADYDNTLSQKLGFLKELIDLDSISFYLGDTAVSSLVADNDHEMTSDIKVKFDEIAAGISVKLNPKFLRGSDIELLNTNSDSVEGKEINKWLSSAEGNNEDIVQALKYYIVNFQALKKYAVNYDNTRVRSKQHHGVVRYSVLDGDIKLEEKTPYDIFNVVEEVKKAVFLGIITKLLLGSAFGDFSNISSFDDVKNKKGLPLILSAGNKVFWTKDILSNSIEIIKQIRLNDKGEGPTTVNIKSFEFYGLPRLKIDSANITKKLEELFKAKLAVPRQTREDTSARRYSELKDDQTVAALLTEINQAFGFIERNDGGQTISDLLLKKWSIKYDYRNLQSKGGK